MAQIDIRAQLAYEGDRRQAALGTVEDTATKIARLAQRAIDQGVPKIEIAELAQISRVTLDKILRAQS